MTVYFVRANNLVKIGHTEDLARRLTPIAAAFPDGIELVAQCDGGREAEYVFHTMFADSQIEGEWFSPTPLLEAMIAKLAHNVGEHRFFGGQSVSNSVCSDTALARSILTDLFEDRVMSVSKNLEIAFNKLFAVNPEWSRRRVRAIWNGEARRIHFFEIADMANVGNVEPYRLAEMIVEASGGRSPVSVAA